MQCLRLSPFSSLLLGISDIEMEYLLEVCRPDMVLLTQKGNVPFIVDKHEPENNVIEYCKTKNIVLIRIKLKSIDDLENIDKKMKFPTNVMFFNALDCPNYRNYLITKSGRIFTRLSSNNTQRTIDKKQKNKTKIRYAILL